MCSQKNNQTTSTNIKNKCGFILTSFHHHIISQQSSLYSTQSRQSNHVTLSKLAAVFPRSPTETLDTIVSPFAGYTHLQIIYCCGFMTSFQKRSHKQNFMHLHGWFSCVGIHIKVVRRIWFVCNMQFLLSVVLLNKASCQSGVD